MATILLFHHVQGLTDGVVAFADRLRAAGHVVHTPDAYGGRVFASIPEGFAHASSLGDERDTAADAAADALAEGPVVYAGISSGVMSAQRLAQTRANAAGALLFEGALPVEGEWAVGPWPVDLPVQIHGMDADEFFSGEGDVDAAREIVAVADDGELFLYPGEGHLFLDNSLPSYDPAATDVVVARVQEFLARL